MRTAKKVNQGEEDKVPVYKTTSQPYTKMSKMNSSKFDLELARKNDKDA